MSHECEFYKKKVLKMKNVLLFESHFHIALCMSYTTKLAMMNYISIYLIKKIHFDFSTIFHRICISIYDLN